MYEQHILEDILFYMLYAAATMLSLLACLYLMFRKGNAFASDITTPIRLSRWATAFFASMTLSHVWYLPSYFLPPGEDKTMSQLIGGLLDSLTVVPFAIAMLFTMLQDRKRSLWPIAVMVAPLTAGMAMGIVNHNHEYIPFIYIYFPIMGIGLIIYMVHEVWRYGRWLRDNYADLEHKEMWQSFVALNIILITFGIYVGGMEWKAYESIIQICDIVLTCFVLWRVETLSDLGNLHSDSVEVEEATAAFENGESSSSSSIICEKIAPLLQRHCIDTHLYLQHDLTLSQLARAVGTNRSYLGQYFSSQGTTYNAYINDLRINHFVDICREAVAAHRPFTAQQFANDSGYRSYSTFSLAFKNRIGQSVTAWIRETTQQS